MPIYVEIILRSTFAYLILLGVARLSGKPFFTMLPVSLAVIAAVFSFDRSIRPIDSLVALLTWSVLSMLHGLIAIKSKNAQTVLNGAETPVIENGKILNNNLLKVRMTIQDLLAQLRQKDVFSLADVEFAVLETDGNVTVMKKSDVQPLTPKTAGYAVQQEAPPSVVIEDGTIDREMLLQMGYPEGKLLQEIQKQGAKTDDDVFFAALDSTDSLYVDLKNDVYKKTPEAPTNKSKRLLLASLKKLEADLLSYTIETENVSAKQAYHANAVTLKRIITFVEPQLLKEADYGPS